MAEENEKKPEFVVHKKQQDSNSAATEKKRVVVVKRKPNQTQSAPKQNGDASKKDGVHVVVKKSPQGAAPTREADSKTVAKNEATTSAPEQKTENRPNTFELNAKRPNVKAGNLSDKGGQNKNGGFNRNQNGFNKNQNGQGGNRPYNKDGNGGGFNGAQARQSYQNRERDNNGQNRQGGFNRNQNGFNRNQNGQGFNKGANGQGGFNRNQNGQGGFRSPRPGMGGGNAAPLPIDNSRTPGKKAAFKGKKQVYNRKDEEQYDDNLFGTKKKVETPASVVPKEIEIMETVSVSDLARKMNLKASEVIGKLMGMGMMVTITQSIDSDTATLLAAEYGCEVHLISLYDETVIESEKDDGVELLPRPPIVTVMGHVDHGKTKTLDAIRNANVAAGEAGGITQSIGAYSVKTDKGRITFLDTPGHEAFTMMRARGAQVTDVAIIIVAADDSIMPQTVEAIQHASAANVPIVFAINKIDKPTANPDKIKEALAGMNYLVEEWGGKYQSQDISAKKGIGVNELLEKVLLEAEMLDLKANPNKNAVGSIIESSLDKGRGYLATVLVEGGTLRQGDVLVAGTHHGRVKAMFNERNQRVKEVRPGEPVLLLGLNGAPQAGEKFNVMDTEQEARDVANKREQLQREHNVRTHKHITLDELGRRIALGNFQELNVIVKGDVDGSIEALSDSLIKLSTPEIQVNVIRKAVGAISESDVLLAAASNAIIVGFQVRPSVDARRLAEKEEVDIRLYSIIYDAIEQLKDAMEGMLSPEIKEEVTATLEVLNIFKISKVGTVAGCLVREGKVKRSNKVRLIRDGIVVHTGELGSLKRMKDDVKEVGTGFECGLNIEKFNDVRVGDFIETYEEIEVKRTF